MLRREREREGFREKEKTAARRLALSLLSTCVMLLLDDGDLMAELLGDFSRQPLPPFRLVPDERRGLGEGGLTAVAVQRQRPLVGAGGSDATHRRRSAGGHFVVEGGEVF